MSTATRWVSKKIEIGQEVLSCNADILNIGCKSEEVNATGSADEPVARLHSAVTCFGWIKPPSCLVNPANFHSVAIVQKKLGMLTQRPFG